MNGVATDDRGFTLGHGLFETILAVNGRLMLWEAHVQRLLRGCPVLGLPTPDPEACREAASVALARAGHPARAAIRLNWSAGPGGRGLDAPLDLRPSLTATAAATNPVEGPAHLVTSAVRRNAQSPSSRLKTLAYLDNVLARAEARAAGADDALMLNTAGEVACAAAANLFWISEGAVLTPALECGVLDGVMRAEVARACDGLKIPYVETRATPAKLRGAPIFLTNSLIGVRRVSRLDSHASPAADLIGRLAAEVAEATG